MVTRTRENLSESVAGSLRERILSRQFEPGAKIPNEFELAEEYGVCRYTIREAVKKLTATGLLTVARGKGTFVNEMVPSDYFKLLIDRLILCDLDTNDIFETRMTIEQKTACLAAEKAVPREIDEMKKTLEKMQLALDNDNLAKFNELDIYLHNQIALAGKNQLLKDVLLLLNDLVRYSIEKASINKAKFEKSLVGHIQIVQAIENKDIDMASQAMYDHLAYCKGLC